MKTHELVIKIALKLFEKCNFPQIVYKMQQSNFLKLSSNFVPLNDKILQKIWSISVLLV